MWTLLAAAAGLLMLGAVAAITFIPEAGALFGRTTETAGALRIEGDADRHLLASGNELLQVTGRIDRKSVVKGKSVSVRLDLGGRSNIKKKKKSETTTYLISK